MYLSWLQGVVQWGPEPLQGWRLHGLPAQPVPVLISLSSESKGCGCTCLTSYSEISAPWARCIKVFRSSISRKASSWLSKQVKLTSVESLTCFKIPLQRACPLRTPSRSASQWATEQNRKLCSAVHTPSERQLQVALGKSLLFFCLAVIVGNEEVQIWVTQSASPLHGGAPQLLNWITVVTVVHGSLTLLNVLPTSHLLQFFIFPCLLLLFQSAANTVTSHWFRCIS